MNQAITKFPEKICYLVPAPVFLKFFVLVLWGWQCDLLIYAIPMGVILAATIIVPTRLNLEKQEFNKITDFCNILFIFVTIYVFYEKSYHGIYLLLTLVPFILYPLILAQSYSSASGINLSALFLSLRRLDDDSEYSNTRINLDYPYIFITLLSSSTGNKSPELFFIISVIFISLFLWFVRAKKRNYISWYILIILTVASAYTGKSGIERLQGIAESVYLDWLDKFMWRSRDPDRTSTAIGTLGKLKLSERIVLRLDTHDKKSNDPIYLRESTYLNYGYGLWTNFQNTMALVDPDLQENSWTLIKDAPNTKKYTISFYLGDDTSVIPAPQSLTGIYNIAATEVQHSPYGTVSIRYKKGWGIYDTAFADREIFDSSPGRDELQIPDIYRKELLNLVEKLGIHNQNDQRKLEIIKKFFSDNFRYTLTQKERYPRGRYLSKFLFETRAGHCEYFATATALLLRAANIPTRYVVGYLVDEYSTLEGQYLARGNHAHSWVLAYINNQWHIVDTTPSIWLVEEKQNDSFIRPFVDFWSWATFRLFSSQKTDQQTNYLPFFYLAIIVMVLYYLWQIFKARKQKLNSEYNKSLIIVKRQGIESCFFEVIDKIKIDYRPIKQGESLRNWLAEILDDRIFKMMEPLIKLHYRLRFDPNKLTNEELSRMDLLKSQVLNELSAMRPLIEEK